MLKKQIITLLISFNFSINIISSDWFQTWNEKRYKEWAKQVEDGYLLNIICIEKDNSYTIARAKLLLQDKGLPGFKVIEKLSLTDKEEVTEKILLWSDSAIKSNI